MSRKILVIYYHEVVTEGNGFSYQKIEMDKFEEQMRYLHDNGYYSMLFSELSSDIPEKSVIVSFDDGFKSVYEYAVPIMHRYGIKGNIYIPTAYISKDKHFMTWNMIRELYNSGEYEFAAHTHNHVDIRNLDSKTFKDEISASDQIIKKELGVLPCAFCMPFGTYDKRSIAILYETKRYKYVLGSHYGMFTIEKSNQAVLPRIGISNDDSIEMFKKKLKGQLNWKGYLQKLRLFYHSTVGHRIEKYEY